LNNNQTIDRSAKITFLMIPKEVPFSRTMPVTAGPLAGMVTGQKKDGRIARLQKDASGSLLPGKQNEIFRPFH
jgi:hypothetical protein